MTIEEAEAIEIIKEFQGTHILPTNLSKALDILIKALEQKPCDDCISRQAVLDLIKSLSNANPSYWNRCDVIDRECLIDDVEQLPSVNPQELKADNRVKNELNQVKTELEQEPKTDILAEIKKIVAKWEGDTWSDNASYECMIKIAGLVKESEVSE